MNLLTSMIMVNSLIQVDELKHVDRIARIEIARKVGRIIQREQSKHDSVDTDEKEAAVEMARLLIEDASIAVREALSLELRQCQYLPKDLIDSIVSDIDQIAMPFLVASDAIDDGFLEQMVHDFGEAVQEAIAKRDGLSEQVSFAICDVAGRDAVENLMDNETADVSKRSAKRVIDRFTEDIPLLDRLAQRADLSIDVVENLIFKLSRQYSEYLMQRFNLSEDYSSYLTTMANRTVFISTLNISPVREIHNYMEQLHSVGQLSADRLLGYLQSSHIRLFTSALAVMADRKYEVVDQALNVGGKQALNRLMNEAKIPANISGVLSVAFERQVNVR
ncbi:DUF2336 domain-containing protein [Temperatibacter marinus]|uniref:DUF2336 domain-containing protein n=1 Tax=Temperatibacter marinus TaxID=1456591 RepID=A0AA52H9W8_9PROT|nr:DUF2336 domain-containing protein [Temperatibacter marinus]WND02120.1 DUF2336 domain-containing protein [Temperatibacter marinus]